MKTFQYRIYPNKAQRRLLMDCLKETRSLYNEMLTFAREWYEKTGKFPSKYDLIKAFKGRGQTSPATVVQCLADRLSKAFQRFFQRKDLGLKGGFPRFKTPNRWHSIHWRQYGRGRDVFFDGKYLNVPGKLGKRLKIKLHRAFEGTPKTCLLVLRADGHWYALIVCEPPVMSADESKPAIGLDMGLRYFVADSDGNTIKAPQFFRKSEANLRVKQRTLSRRKKGSRRSRKAAKAVAKLHLTIQRQRRDGLFKLAKFYTDQNSIIMVEDLNISGMMRNHHLAKSISDAAWNEFLEILEYKAESAGGQVIRVPSHYTSQKCSACGAIISRSLSVRTHVCSFCGFVGDRDVNAARNILEAGAQPSGANVEDVISSVA